MLALFLANFFNVKQLIELLGLGKGKNVIEQISSIIRIIQALISAVQHFNERLTSLESGGAAAPAPAGPAAAGSAPVASDAGLAELERQADAVLAGTSY